MGIRVTIRLELNLGFGLTFRVMVRVWALPQENLMTRVKIGACGIRTFTFILYIKEPIT